jgi:hypothetical protein
LLVDGQAADSDVPITKTPSARSARSARPRRASVLSASGGVTKHVAVQQAMSDDDEGGEGGTVLLREWLYKNFLHPYPVRRPQLTTLLSRSAARVAPS